MAVQDNSDDTTPPLDPTARVRSDEPSPPDADATSATLNPDDSPPNPGESSGHRKPVPLQVYLMTMMCLQHRRDELLRLLKTMRRNRGLVGFEAEEDDIFQSVCLIVANWKHRIDLDSAPESPAQPSVNSTRLANSDEISPAEFEQLILADSEELSPEAGKSNAPTDEELRAKWLQLRPELAESPEALTDLMSRYYPLVVRMFKHVVADRQRYLLAKRRDARRTESGHEQWDNLATSNASSVPELDTDELLQFMESRAEKLLSPLLQQVRLLRKEGVGWDEIGLRVDRHPDAIRKLYRAHVDRLVQQIL
ncbi:hypothetical protein [Tuwongella immobilis]|uniref:Uncharacterized protein n=1 Tax=Tuwongella immobilis TaxID=692036 RepID=A0A6C2YT61_9BACT|nr:hypothetical protein [Tuwongella immobilis]VIP04584.1 unnamed protein product [Tuwongella immobilis]VTS06529.1 unnamed protein product [Tuwongella immobilis]